MRALYVLALPLILAAPCLAQEERHPYQGGVLDLAAEVQVLREAETPAQRRILVGELLRTLYKDVAFKEVAEAIGLRQRLLDLADGRGFDREGMRRAVGEAVRSASERRRGPRAGDVAYVFGALEAALAASPQPVNGSPAVDRRAVGESELARLLSRRSTRVMEMEPIPGASLVRGEGLERYGLQLVPGGRPARGTARSGLAHREVGRAVLGPGLPLFRGSQAETAEVFKGVGPTPWANNKNRFNHKATGTFPLAEAIRDWDKSLELRRAGVAVYEPVAIVQTPYLEWKDGEGWRPTSVYVRRPQENLRVSDLDHLSTRQRRKLADSLRGKIQANLESVGRTDAVSRQDVIRFFAERIGRTAGLFQGGMPGAKSMWFHGMLHEQNVSLMGEVVDVGNSEGAKASRASMRAAWRRSVYPAWPDRIPRYEHLRGATAETAIFWSMVQSVNRGLGPVAGGAILEAELRQLFDASYQEGRRGESARDPRTVLRPRTPRTASPEMVPRSARAFERSAGMASSPTRGFDRALSETGGSLGLLGRLRGVAGRGGQRGSRARVRR